MSKRRSDALTALVSEIVDLDVEIDAAEASENAAHREYVAAHEEWQATVSRRDGLQDRLTTTGRALAIIASRDNIADDVVEALKDRLRR